MMNILLAVRSDLGMGSHIQPRALALAEAGHKIHILAGQIGKIDQVRQLHPEISWIDAGGLGVWHFARQLGRQVTHLKPDLLYVHSSWTIPSFYLSGSFLSGIKWVYHTDDYLEPKSYYFYKKLEKHFCHKALLVISNEINRARFMATEYHLKHKPLILPVTLSKKMAPPEDGFWAARRNGKPTLDLVYAGGIGPDRLIKEMIQSLTFLPENFRLTIFSRFQPEDAYWQLCQETIKSASLENRVICCNPIPNEELLQELLKYDVGLLLYDDNTLGNFYCQPQKLSEYIASGLPVVGPHYPGVELLIRKHGLGAVCDPKSPEAVAQAILAVAAHDKVARENQFLHLRNTFFQELAYENHSQALIQALAELPLP